MNKDIMKEMGFDKEVKAVEVSKCPFCKKDIDLDDFKDSLSEREFAISGLCQDCQDKTFGGKKKKSKTFIGENDYLIKRQPIFSGSHEAQKREYIKLEGKSGRTWLVPTDELCTADIHVSAGPRENVPGYRGFRGYGGSTLTFKLKEGGEIKLQGPWNSNADALFADTGYDIRDKHLTFVVISKGRDFDERGQTIARDVIYKDEKPMIGLFHRGDMMAREYAKKLNMPVFCYSGTRGGSSSGQIKPDRIFYWEKEINHKGRKKDK